MNNMLQRLESAADGALDRFVMFVAMTTVSYIITVVVWSRQEQITWAWLILYVIPFTFAIMAARTWNAYEAIARELEACKVLDS